MTGREGAADGRGPFAGPSTTPSLSCRICCTSDDAGPAGVRGDAVDAVRDCLARSLPAPGLTAPSGLPGARIASVTGYLGRRERMSHSVQAIAGLS